MISAAKTFRCPLARNGEKWPDSVLNACVRAQRGSSENEKKLFCPPFYGKRGNRKVSKQ